MLEENTVKEEITPSDYLLFFRSTVWERGLSAGEIDEVMARLTAWYDALDLKGMTDGGMRLSVEGRIVSKYKGRLVSDGPFVESKEAIAGYVHVRTRGMDEAVAIARSWPGLAYGLSIEVRPVVPTI
jgi:hypothetical protein